MLFRLNDVSSSRRTRFVDLDLSCVLHVALALKQHLLQATTLLFEQLATPTTVGKPPLAIAITVVSWIYSEHGIACDAYDGCIDTFFIHVYVYLTSTGPNGALSDCS